jgi:hypothetical protein
MRTKPRPTVGRGIVAVDQQRFIDSRLREVELSVRRTVLDRIGLAASVQIDQVRSTRSPGATVCALHTASEASQRTNDRAPEIDELNRRSRYPQRRRSAFALRGGIAPGRCRRPDVNRRWRLQPLPSVRAGITERIRRSRGPRITNAGRLHDRLEGTLREKLFAGRKATPAGRCQSLQTRGRHRRSRATDDPATGAAQAPRALDDVDFAAISGNFAIYSGLKLANAFALEKMTTPYINVVAVKRGNADS